jgi:Transposase.
LAAEILRKVGAENEHRRRQNSPKKKASVQDFSSAMRKMEMLFCRELPVKKPGFIITTHWKIQPMEWQHQASPCKNKFKVQTSADTAMASVFWDSEGTLLMEF